MQAARAASMHVIAVPDPMWDRALFAQVRVEAVCVCVVCVARGKSSLMYHIVRLTVCARVCECRRIEFWPVWKSLIPRSGHSAVGHRVRTTQNTDSRLLGRSNGFEDS